MKFSVDLRRGASSVSSYWLAPAASSLKSNGTDYFLSSLDLRIFRFTVCFLKLEHIVRNLLVYVKMFFHKFLK